MATPSWNPFRRRRSADTRWKRDTLQTGHHRPMVVADENAEDEVVEAPGLEQWQDLVLKYADKVPIVSAGSRFYEESTKRVRFYLADQATGQPYSGGEGDTTQHKAQEIIEILTVFREDIARATGLRFLVGESRHTFDLDKKVLTTRGAGELYAKKDTGYYLKERDGKEQKVEDSLRVWRSYDPDRKWSDLATSSHKAMLDILEAFVIAYAEERAVSIRNALNTGVLGISEDVFLAGAGDEDPQNSEGSSESASLEARLHQMFAMTIRNPRDSANFVTPVLVTPSGMKPSEAIEHISIAADRDKRQIAARIKMLKEEYAVGVDLPADQAAGFMSDMNHWNGRLVSEKSWTDYLAPKIQSVVADAFEEIATALEIDTTGVTVGLDNSNLVSKDEEPGFAYDQANGIVTRNERRKQLDLPEKTGWDDTVPEYLASLKVDTEVDIAAATTTDDPAADAGEPVDTDTDTPTVIPVAS